MLQSVLYKLVPAENKVMIKDNENLTEVPEPHPVAKKQL